MIVMRNKYNYDYVVVSELINGNVIVRRDSKELLWYKTKDYVIAFYERYYYEVVK